jgi:MFS family permease
VGLVSGAPLLCWVANRALRPFLPLRLEDLGVSHIVIGMAVASASVVALVAAVPSRRLLDRLPERRVVGLSTLALALATAGMAVTTSVAVLVVEMVVQGVFGMWAWLALQ